MCHPKPPRRSRLSLNDVDHILMPFFGKQQQGKHSLEETAEATSLPNMTPEGASSGTCHSPTDPERLGDSSTADREPPGDLGNGGGALGEVRTDLTDGRARSAMLADSAVLTEAGLSSTDEVAPRIPVAPPDPPAKPVPSPPRRLNNNPNANKRIRLTGVIGEFLDSSTVWADFAVMEAERKADQESDSSSKNSNRSETRQPLAAAAAPFASTPAAAVNQEGEDTTGGGGREATGSEGVDPTTAGERGPKQPPGGCATGDVQQASESHADEPESPKCRPRSTIGGGNKSSA